MRYASGEHIEIGDAAELMVGDRRWERVTVGAIYEERRGAARVWLELAAGNLVLTREEAAERLRSNAAPRYSTGDAVEAGDVIAGRLLDDAEGVVVVVHRSGPVVQADGFTRAMSLEDLAAGGIGLVRRAEVAP